MTTEIRKQMRAIGTHLGLSPVVDVARDFRWGRSGESFGEDPYLVASMGTAYIRGCRAMICAPVWWHPGSISRGTVRLKAAETTLRSASPRELRKCISSLRSSHPGSQSPLRDNAYHSIDGIPCAGSGSCSRTSCGELGFEGLWYLTTTASACSTKPPGGGGSAPGGSYGLGGGVGYRMPHH